MLTVVKANVALLMVSRLWGDLRPSILAVMVNLLLRGGATATEKCRGICLRNLLARVYRTREGKEMALEVARQTQDSDKIDSRKQPTPRRGESEELGRRGTGGIEVDHEASQMREWLGWDEAGRVWIRPCPYQCPAAIAPAAPQAGPEAFRECHLSHGSMGMCEWPTDWSGEGLEDLASRGDWDGEAAYPVGISPVISAHRCWVARIMSWCRCEATRRRLPMVRRSLRVRCTAAASSPSPSALAAAALTEAVGAPLLAAALFSAVDDSGIGAGGAHARGWPAAEIGRAHV